MGDEAGADHLADEGGEVRCTGVHLVLQVDCSDDEGGDGDGDGGGGGGGGGLTTTTTRMMITHPHLHKRKHPHSQTVQLFAEVAQGDDARGEVLDVEHIDGGDVCSHGHLGRGHDGLGLVFII